MWKEYQREEQHNETRIQEHRSKMLNYNGKTMKYVSITKGEKPPGGYSLYIALHGGGGEPVEVNNKGWERMKGLYVQSIAEGIYVVPRGITDTWDMHFRPESYLLYKRLIENMILFEDVNSDKVYVLGYSAGGDGVYQIGARLADRFAAVHTSAGHHNWVEVKNLASLPIALQAGEYDDEYCRNFETAKMSNTLDLLAKNSPGYYIHTTWIHRGKGHRFIDNAPDEEPQTVLTDLKKWQTLKTSESSKHNTNAISWLRQFLRNPRPKQIIWDLKTWSHCRGENWWKFGGHGQQFYWVDIGDKAVETLGVDTIIVRLEPGNMIKLVKFGKFLRLLVDSTMLNLGIPVKVTVDGYVHTIFVQTSRDIQVETLRQRGDPRYIFEGSITVVRDNGVQIKSP